MKRTEEGQRSQLSLLTWARREVPATRYAIGIAGVAAAGAILMAFFARPAGAVLVVGFMLAGMVLLLVFSRLSQSHSSHMTAAGLTLMWAVVACFIAFLGLTIIAVSTGKPDAWARLLNLEQTPPNQLSQIERLAVRVGVRDTADGRRALNQLVALAGSGEPEKAYIVRVLKGKLLAIDDDMNDRENRLYRRILMGAVLNAADRDMTSAFERGDLSDTKFVGMDLKEVDARGMDFSDSFLLNSDFERADLRGANFSGTFLRGVDFQNAQLGGTNWTRNADWFNAVGIDSAELDDDALKSMAECPPLKRGNGVFDNFIAAADAEYAVPFKSWRTDEQQTAQGYWTLYESAMGMCARVKAAHEVPQR